MNRVEQIEPDRRLTTKKQRIKERAFAGSSGSEDEKVLIFYQLRQSSYHMSILYAILLSYTEKCAISTTPKAQGLTPLTSEIVKLRGLGGHPCASFFTF